MAKLSVNINKIAVLRNSRGGSMPDVAQAAVDCERWGAQGITVHPRPDERHIRRTDVLSIAKHITTEFNIEGYPSDSFVELLLQVRPTQATLVPDAPDAITSSAGWNTIEHSMLLSNVVKKLHSAGIRASIFVDANVEMVRGAATIGADRVELFTGPYAEKYSSNPQMAVASYLSAAREAQNLGLQVNAGHDLNLENLRYFLQNVPQVCEVSIGHALICDALRFGLENTIQMYLKECN